MSVVCDLPVGELYAIAQQAARRYCRAMPWLEVDDVAQAAIVEMLEAAQRVKTAPDSWAAYLARVANLTVRAYAWTTTAPVTLSSDRGTLATQAQAAMRDISAPPDRTREGTQADDVDAGRWARKVRRRVRQAIGNDAPVDREIARRVLLEDADPAEAAAETGQTARHVYVVSQRIKNRILRDAQVQQLWREMPSREQADEVTCGS